MNKPMLVKAVLFDWDLTLAHTVGAETPEERLTLLFQTEGLPYHLDDIVAAQNRCARGQNSATVTIVPQTKQAIKASYAALLRELHHPVVNEPLLERLYHGFTTLPAQLYADVVPTVLRLQAVGYALGIITNHTAKVRAVIRQMVGAYFPDHAIIISEEEAIYKPDAAIFQTAAARLGVVPAECVFVGDNQQVDAAGAVAQGGFQRGFWLNRGGEPFSPPLPHKVNQMHALHDIFSLI